MKLQYLFFFLLLIPFAQASDDIATNGSSNGTAIDLTAIWTEYENLSLASTNAGQVYIGFSVVAKVNYSQGTIYGRMKRDGTQIEILNLTSSTSSQSISFFTSRVETAGSHYYSFEAYSTTGRKGSISNRTFMAMFFKNGSVFSKIDTLNNTKVNKSGDTMTGDIDFNNNNITQTELINNVNFSNSLIRTTGIIIDDTLGEQGNISIPVSGTIIRVRVEGNANPGNATINLWNRSTNIDMTGGNNIVISNTQNLTDTTLTGWTKTITSDTILRFNLSSITNFTELTINIDYRVT